MHITTTVSCNKVCYKSIKGGLFCGNIQSLILMLSFLGPTEREILENLDVVEHALPIEKMKMAYSDLNTAKNLILIRCNAKLATV